MNPHVTNSVRQLSSSLGIVFFLIFLFCTKFKLLETRHVSTLVLFMSNLIMEGEGISRVWWHVEPSSGSSSNHQSEYEGENQCWEPVSDAIHPSLKLIIIRWLPITRGPDIEGHVSWLWGTCPRVGPLPMRELITGPLWVKWAPVIITPRINHGSRVAIDTFYRCPRSIKIRREQLL